MAVRTAVDVVAESRSYSCGKHAEVFRKIFLYPVPATGSQVA